MAALTAERNTKIRATQGALSTDLALPMKAAAKVFKGGLVVVDATGYAKAGGGAVATERVAGIAQETVDNTTGANGAKTVKVRRGVAKLANFGTDLVGGTSLLADCFAEDDQTVRATSATNTRSRAGRVIAIDADGVWVETF